MEYAVYEIKYDYDTDIETEARFYIASARADGAVLVRFDLRYGEEKRTVKRRLAVLVRLLKQMKRESLIQFFATEEDFTNMSMEADFMYNKYEKYISTDKSASSADTFVYIKI